MLALDDRRFWEPFVPICSHISIKNHMDRKSQTRKKRMGKADNGIEMDGREMEELESSCSHTSILYTEKENVR